MVSDLANKRRIPIVTVGLIVICVLVYLYEMKLSHSANISTDVLVQLGASNKELIKLQPWRAFTSMWLHLTPSHIIFNMFFLWVVGSQLECIFGHWRFLFVYLLSGMVGDTTAAMFSKNNVVSAGASTALFGLIGAGIIIGLLHPSLHFLAHSLISTFVANIIYDLLCPGISLTGHLGGLVGGLILGFLLRPPLGVIGVISNMFLEIPIATLVTLIGNYMMIHMMK